MKHLRAFFFLILTCLACLVPAMAASGFAVGVDELAKPLQQQLRALGLGQAGAPEIPQFQWRLEYKRPLRRAREVQEHFAGSAAGQNSGLSPSFRYDFPGAADKASLAVSGRGLLRVSPEDKELGVRLEGLSFPLDAAKPFRISFREPGIDFTQTCVVAGKVQSSQLHASISGESSRIQCAGQGKYKGFDVKVTSTVFFIEALGMFLNTLDLIDSPLGNLRSSTRIVDFKLGA